MTLGLISPSSHWLQMPSAKLRDALKKKKTQIGKRSLKKVGGQHHFPIKIIPEIGNTLVLVGESSKIFPVWSNEGPRLVMDLFGISLWISLVYERSSKTSSGKFQGSFEENGRVYQQSFSEFHGCCQEDWRLFQQSFNRNPRVFARISLGVGEKFQMYFKGVLRKL